MHDVMQCKLLRCAGTDTLQTCYCQTRLNACLLAAVRKLLAEDGVEQSSFGLARGSHAATAARQHV